MTQRLYVVVQDVGSGSPSEAKLALEAALKGSGFTVESVRAGYRANAASIHDQINAAFAEANKTGVDPEPLREMVRRLRRSFGLE